MGGVNNADDSAFFSSMETKGAPILSRRLQRHSMSEELISKYLNCRECSIKCCKGIGPNILIDQMEDVPRDKISARGNFFKVSDDKGKTCIYFDGDWLCETYKRRPFVCRAYPFAVASGKLFVNLSCPDGKKFLEGINAGVKGMVRDIKIIKDWLERKIPPGLKNFWDAETDAGRPRGSELKLKV